MAVSVLHVRATQAVVVGMGETVCGAHGACVSLCGSLCEVWRGGREHVSTDEQMIRKCA